MSPSPSRYDLNQIITKTRLYNFDPLKPHFNIVKLGFTGVYIIFLISAQNHRLWVLVRTASSRQFYRVPTIYVLSRNKKKYQNFYLKIFIFMVVKFSVYLNRHVFVMYQSSLFTSLLIKSLLKRGLYGAFLLRAFTYHCTLISIWQCWKGCKTPNHHPTPERKNLLSNFRLP